MKVQIKKPSVRQDVERAVLTYLEGDVLLKSQVSLILKTFKPEHSPVPLYRTFRAQKNETGRTRDVEFKSAFVSASLTPEASLFAALSYAHDMDQHSKYFVVCRFDSLETLISHRKLVEITHAKGKPHQMRRTLREEEVLVLGGKSFKGASIHVVDGRLAELEYRHLADSPQKIRQLLEVS